MNLLPAEGALGTFTVAETDNSFRTHTFTTEGVEFINANADGSFSATVKMVARGSHWTETIVYSGGRVALLRDCC